MKSDKGLGKPKLAMKKPKQVMKKPKAKASPKMAALEKAKKKNKLNKANLEKLGQMSLADKIKVAAETEGTEEDQAEVLKASLTKAENSQVWSKHQTHLKNNPLEKGELEGLSKKEKGLKAAQWLLQTQGKKYLHVRKEVQAKEATTKRNQWVSEKKMLDNFGWDELQMHLASGRIVYREDPTTPNVWQYKDTQDFSNEVVVKRGSKWQQGQELEPDETHEQEFSKLYYQESMGLGLEDIAGGSKGKSFGKGKGKGKNKSSGKGKGPGLLALKDKEEEQEEEEEKPEEEELKEALKKARKARDAVTKAQSDLEEALGKASPKLSRQGRAGAEGWSAQLTKSLAQLKLVLGGKKETTSAKLKSQLEEVAKVVKGAKDEAKELRQLSNKTVSVAASKRSRSSK